MRVRACAPILARRAGGIVICLTRGAAARGRGRSAAEPNAEPGGGANAANGTRNRRLASGVAHFQAGQKRQESEMHDPIESARAIAVHPCVTRSSESDLTGRTPTRHVSRCDVPLRVRRTYMRRMSNVTARRSPHISLYMQCVGLAHIGNRIGWDTRIHWERSGGPADTQTRHVGPPALAMPSMPLATGGGRKSITASASDAAHAS